MNTARFTVFCLIIFCLIRSATAASPDTKFTDIKGVEHSPLRTEQSNATVLLFVWHTCPTANSYAPEIERLYKTYKDKKVKFYLVQIDRDVTTSRAQQHAKDYGYTLPVIIDRDHELVKHVDAKITPEAAVLLPDGKLIYRGRIDNRQAALGKRRPKASVLDLRNTLDAILANEELEFRTTKAVGCYIPGTD